jgi:hypothetical protein
MADTFGQSAKIGKIIFLQEYRGSLAKVRVARMSEWQLPNAGRRTDEGRLGYGGRATGREWLAEWLAMSGLGPIG